ncbi:MAG TPA: phosphatase domain-containing protein [Gemmatimonadaceae bacterium]|nr:phosphatase domain-containing protein [Gemmatimonadaceae bacterium]
MTSWRTELRDMLAELAGRARDAAGAVERLVDRDPYHVVGYRGYGTPERALVLGRVLQDEGLAPPDPRQSRWLNLVAALKRLESDPLPFARVRARLHDAEREIVADDEGFVRAWLELPRPVAAHGWTRAELELRAPDGATRRATSHILVPPSTAAFGVVSDMDDTVLQSRVTSFLRAARLVLLENALTRLPFPGVAAFYRALERGTGAASRGNPIFYVSSSPWNLYEVIAGFIEAQGIPAGPLLLRDWDLGALAGRHQAHKGAAIREILEGYPALPFILIGDSGQEDPEIYASLVREHPGRILAIYIRNVTPFPERSASIRALAAEVAAHGSALVLADDTLAAARHAAAHGWITEDALPEIGEEKRADEGTTPAKAAAPGTPEPGASPTVVVDQQVPAREITKPDPPPA